MLFVRRFIYYARTQREDANRRDTRIRLKQGAGEKGGGKHVKRRNHEFRSGASPWCAAPSLSRVITVNRGSSR